MPRTAGGLRADPTTRLAELARERPEWQEWIGLLELAWRAVKDARNMPLDETELSLSDPTQPAPLLNGRTLRVSPGESLRLVRSVASRSLNGFRPTEADVLALVAAAICQRSDELERIAAERRMDPGALASVAHMAALPLLQACGRQLQGRVLPQWSKGYCPICAAWPVLAERRGLDRSRRLRCGRCAADWEVEWLLCVYCGERDHRKLGSLVPDDSGELLKVETCETCRGYVKSIASLQGLLPFELLLQDLETVELDLVALDRGYRRPHTGGFELHVSVLEHAARPGL